MRFIQFFHKIIQFIVKLSVLKLNSKDSVYSTHRDRGADILEAPFTVHISPTGCTGALIHPLWVITSAHCTSQGPQSVYVGFGASDKNKGSYYIKGTVTFLYPQFYNNTSDESPDSITTATRSDIALIELSAPAKLSETVKVLNLEVNKWPTMGNRTCILAGYENCNPDDTKLRLGKMSATKDCECLTKTGLLCARWIEGHIPYNGDAGSVLVYDNKGVAVLSKNLASSFCTDRTKAMKEMAERDCNTVNGMYLFSTIEYNLEWIEAISEFNKARKIHENNIEYYEKFTSLQMSSLLPIFLFYLNG